MLRGIFRRRSAAAGDAGELLPRLLENIEQFGLIRCPLVLISQISRSGGTWVSQLFDHHPHVWAHPLELRIGSSRKWEWPGKWDWPRLSSVSDPQDAWHTLRYTKAQERFGAGAYYKGNDQIHPMLFNVDIQRALFLRLAANWTPSTDREWFNIYFTSFFSAWLDHQRRYGPKRYVTAFASMLALAPASMARFRQVYPDGWLISIIREPLGWYSSVKQHASGSEKHKNLKKRRGREGAETAYLDNIQAIHDNRELFGERFVLVDYDALVSDTETTMRTLAARIDLDWHPSLTRQTFNGMTIQPNTSFQGERAKNRASILTEEDVARINDGPMKAAYLTTRPR